MPRVLTEADLEQFRVRLCDAAARLYFELGHSGFNMRDLAASVGVSAMTPYRYFAGKEEILATIRARAAGRLADRLEASLPQGAAAVMQAYIDFAMQEAAYYRLIFDLTQPHKRSDELMRQARRVRSVMVSAAATGPHHCATAMLAESLWAGLHGGVCLVLAGTMSATELSGLASCLASMSLGVSTSFVIPPLRISRDAPQVPGAASQTEAATIAAE